MARHVPVLLVLSPWAARERSEIGPFQPCHRGYPVLGLQPQGLRGQLLPGNIWLFGMASQLALRKITDKRERSGIPLVLANEDHL